MVELHVLQKNEELPVKTAMLLAVNTRQSEMNAMLLLAKNSMLEQELRLLRHVNVTAATHTISNQNIHKRSWSLSTSTRSKRIRVILIMLVLIIELLKNEKSVLDYFLKVITKPKSQWKIIVWDKKYTECIIYFDTCTYEYEYVYW